MYVDKSELVVQKLNSLISSDILSARWEANLVEAVNHIINMDKEIASLNEQQRLLYIELSKERDEGNR